MVEMAGVEPALTRAADSAGRPVASPEQIGHILNPFAGPIRHTGEAYEATGPAFTARKMRRTLVNSSQAH